MKILLYFAKRPILIVSLFILIISSNVCALAGQPQVSIVTDKMQGAPFLHGLNKLTAILKAKHITFEQVTSLSKASGSSIIVTGLSAGNGPASQLIKAGNRVIPTSTEALTEWKTTWKGKRVWVISGFDDKGVMYALLDVADRISWSKDSKHPLNEVKEITEKPDVHERAIAMYTMNRAYWESRFYDEKYWIRYFDMMAQDRLNMLEILFGYENGGFMAPCYPYFFNVDGFDDVRMVGLTQEQQERNLATMNNLIKMAHDRGIGIRLGIWDHIYSGGVQSGGVAGAEKVSDKPVPGLVWGLNAGNLGAYTKAAFAKFVKVIPGLDGILFHINNEAGLKQSELLDFGLNFFRTVKESAPDMQIDIHAKGLTDSLINGALNLGVKFRISPKYWMEQMGLPYHSSHINRENQFDRRQSYDNMLSYPQRYKMLWKYWNGGTTRVLLWGDPEYARRFAESTHLYNGDGYAVYEPLATKMEAQPHNAQPFDLLKPPYRYYDYEFERYWHFYQVFGRMGYDPETSPDIWNKEFEKRFGAQTALFIEAALHEASWVLPRIVASCYPYSYFPTTSAWPEKQRLGDLPLYAKAEGSDTEQFAGFDEEAQLLLNGGETAKTLPSMTSRWLEQVSVDINQQIADAEKTIGNNRSKEYNSTIADLKILSNMALYHSRRIPAAISYCLFQRTHDIAALDAAIAYERNATEAWRQLVASAGDFYADDLAMGNRNKGLSGHWRDELTALEKGITKLEDERRDFKPDGNVKLAPHYKTATDASNSKYFQISHQPVISAPVGKPITINIKINAPAGVKRVHLRYRSVNQEKDYQTLQMAATGEKDMYQAVVPADQINPKWDFMYLIEVMDNNSKGFIYPDLNKETPYVVVKLIR
jgi:hypothetical protein